ncbi:uncharacterized protein LOC108478935 [Gossypium arboreum]|uniref:uncharacterized protein LOC108478935 n=1 Tax=Gossypium arboreum TaxID=29729 RepID=UPI0022F19624|nr:uncharacterized protein LOC108478935 [Gossypium arboreum]
MNSPLQRMPQIRFRGLIIYFIITMTLLYISYSNLLFSKKDRKSSDITIVSNKIEAPPFNHSSNTTSSHVQNPADQKRPNLVEPPPRRYLRYDTHLKHIAFGIASSSNLWEIRKEYIKTWWRPKETRGVVWLDKKVVAKKGERLPEIRVSEDTSQFKYLNKVGSRSALRITRVVSETLKLGMTDIRWFVMGDDDTIFIVENLVRVLSKYDHTQYYYIGSASESHIQNILFSYSMAYGGGGFAISYPLAKELSKMQDQCIHRYPALYGSDDRIQACMAELGVPLTRELGFHQYDVVGDILGLLGAHPVTPLVSLHHLDVVNPIYPGMKRAKALAHMLEAANEDSASLMQQSICYDSKRYWSITVSWGYAVQILRGVMSPRELEMPSRTFFSWHKRADYTAYAFNTRPVERHPCQRPFVFYMYKTKTEPETNQTVGLYYRHRTRSRYCRWKMASPEELDFVVVIKQRDEDRWLKAPRRDCCRAFPKIKNNTMILYVGNCKDGEISEFQPNKLL